MTTPFPALGHTRRDVRWPRLVLVTAVAAACSMSGVRAQAPSASAVAVAAIPAETLEKLVGRIALYPDDLVAIILPAATNPLQVVQADRFLEKRKANPKAPVDEKSDDAIKSLLNYPEVVKAMSGDLDWTAALGEAVVADQGGVLEAVQAFRRKTQSAGNLKTDAKQVVVVEKEVIKIVPADPQVIYVPQYNPTTVVVTGGYSAWGYYPSPYPVYYYPYPPGAAFATGLVWGAAISSAWNGNHYAAHYGSNASINVNRNVNVNTGNINTGNVNVNRSAAVAGGSTQWKSGKQPGQVSGTVGTTRPARAGDARTAGAAAGSTVAARPSTQVAAAGTGGGASRYQPSNISTGSGAFEGYGSGRQAQMDSSRGAASRSASMPDRGTRQGRAGVGRGGR
ncbi:DUF3300 domain-containing protein [Variovorax sp. DT-64]|uniref:DUF3300 domain-containing protein n=1 Tax=Variovorax sp. DT-64 TaxID=3396160 RepID=UPI003F1BE456